MKEDTDRLVEDLNNEIPSAFKTEVDAIRNGKFHIYPVSTINEGIEILTGIEAGEQDETGKYPQGTLNFAVQARLKELAEKVKSFSFSVNGEKE